MPNGTYTDEIRSYRNLSDVPPPKEVGNSEGIYVRVLQMIEDSVDKRHGRTPASQATKPTLVPR